MQIVIIAIMEEVKIAHKEILMVVGDPLIGCMHAVTKENKGFLEDADLPTWIDEQSCSVIKTRSKFWFAHLGQLKQGSNGTVIPSSVILLTQFTSKPRFSGY